MTEVDNLRRLQLLPWHETEVGAMADWPVEMRVVVDTALHSAFPIWTAWGEGGIQIYNDAYLPILGLKHPASFGRPARDSWPEIWAFLGPALAQVRATGEPLWFKGMLLPLSKQGRPEECYFDFSYSPVFDAQRRVIGVMAVALEKTAEAVMLRRAPLYALTVDSAGLSWPSAMDALRSVLADNEMDAAAAIFYAADPNTGLPADAIWRLRCGAGADRLLRSTAAGQGSDAVVRVALQASPGRAGQAGYAHVLPLATRSGRRLGTLVLVPNELVPLSSHFEFATQLAARLRTAIHAAEARTEEIGRLRDDLAERDALNRFLFENMEDAAFYAATDGTPDSEEFILAANGRACQMLGYTPAELIGMAREALFFPADADLQSALRARSQDGAFLGELVFRRKDGAALPIEISSRLVPLRGGGIRSISMVRDISRRRARELERAQRARFESMVQLTGGISHDFNNFLTVIIGSLDALLEDLPPGTPEWTLAGNALLGAEHAATLNNQLLAYAKRQTLQTQSVQMADFVRQVTGLLASTLGGSGMLDVRTEPDLPSCELDPAQLTSALLNLVANARDAGRSGSPVVIRTRSLQLASESQGPDGHALPAGRYVALSVEDSGAGIAQQEQLRIFEPFFTTKAGQGGSGLGLAMVQGFARQSGGDVRVASEVGRGSRFELLFPAHGEPQAPGA